MLKVIASEVATLDSNVLSGGGTDVTEALQKVLDMATENNGVHLIMDGAALIRGLKIHSNTVIECLNQDCGFYMADGANRPIISNYNWSYDEITTRNVKIIGGTYNHNCTHQVHHLPPEEFPYPVSEKENVYANTHGIMLMELSGIENLTIDGVLFKNQRVYALCLTNFENVLLENVTIDMADHVHPSNQDGLHFYGPGRFLTMRNIKGCTGDDFINLAPDELDGESHITDVLIDGVFLDDTRQGIRMLSRRNGSLDRVTIRNVTGTYRTFAFSIMPFIRGNTYGNFGDIFIENVDLRQSEEYHRYTPLSFMELGGNVEHFTLKNVRFHSPHRKNLFIDLGRPFFYRPKELTVEEAERCHVNDIDVFGEHIYWLPETGERPNIKNFTLDNCHIDCDEKTDDMTYISLKHNIENLNIKNVHLYRGADATPSGKFIKMENEAKVKNLFLQNIYTEKLESVLSGDEEHSIDFLVANNIILRDGGKIFDTDKVSVNHEIKTDVHEIGGIK